MSAAPEACWRRIGVYGGDLSCPTLVSALHCRNCPVFSAAARSLFERDDSAAEVEIETVAARMASGLRALLFRLGAQWFALPTAHLAEVAQDRPARRLAHRTGGRLQGLVNLRGELQPCVALAALFGLAPAAASGEPKLIVFRAGADALLAFRADAVRGLLYYQPEQIQAPPATYAEPLASCVAGILADGDLQAALLDGPALTRVLNEGLFA